MAGDGNHPFQSRLAEEYVDENDHYAYFDSLPRELRDFLNECPYLQSSREVVESLGAGRTPEQIMEAVRGGMMTLMRKEQKDVWGTSDRRVDWESCGPVSRVRPVVRRRT